MVNGDAESRSRWVSYALGAIGTSVFGTKGVGPITKMSAATTKAGMKKAVNSTKNVELPDSFPYGSSYEFATAGVPVAYNVVNDIFLKNQLLIKNKGLGTKGTGNTNRLIAGKPGVVTGDNSNKLGKNMMENMGLKRSTKWSGYQAQHIIPSQMMNNPVIQKIGMNFDDLSNGIFLRVPNKDISTMSRHRGYHSIF